MVLLCRSKRCERSSQFSLFEGASLRQDGVNRDEQGCASGVDDQPPFRDRVYALCRPTQITNNADMVDRAQDTTF